MAGMINKLARKTSDFVDSKVIFVTDCFLSVLSSLFALLALGFVRGSFYQSGRFALLWLPTAFVATVVAMLTACACMTAVPQLRLSQII